MTHLQRRVTAVQNSPPGKEKPLPSGRKPPLTLEKPSPSGEKPRRVRGKRTPEAGKPPPTIQKPKPTLGKPPPTTPANVRTSLRAEVAEDNRTWFKSYLLQTPSPGADGRFGIQFFYHPDYRYRIAFQHPAFFALFGPSFIALCIALPLAFSRVRIGPAMALFTLAALFHVASFLLFLVGVRYGEAWSGYGPAHNSPFVHLVIGLGVLLVLILIRLSPRTTKSA